eukprot:scaffold242349_cov30-Tisochrysis_lutea.AAC.4
MWHQGREGLAEDESGRCPRPTFLRMPMSRGRIVVEKAKLCLHTSCTTLDTSVHLRALLAVDVRGLVRSAVAML